MSKKTIEWPILRRFKHSSTGKRLWEVDATLNGKRERRYFKERKDAEIWQFQKHTERAHHRWYLPPICVTKPLS
jgi:hypothetical protein